MPELPEVETVRKGLQQYLAGQSFDKVDVFTTKLRWQLPESLAESLANRSIRSVTRRGKYLLLEVSDGNYLIAHLGMSGSFGIYSINGLPPETNMTTWFSI